MRWRQLWGGLLACGVTASLLTFPTAAATSTRESSASSGSNAACTGDSLGAETLSGHAGTAFLTNATTRQSEHFTFYVAAEGAATSSILRASTVAGCYDAPTPDFARTRVRYTTDPGSATAGVDYTHVTAPTTPTNPPESVEDQTGWICNDIHELGCTPPRSPNDPSERPTPVTLLQSPGGDAVKSFRIRLTAAQIDGSNGLSPFSLSNTSSQGRSRTVHVVDDDGTSRFSLEPTFSNANQAITYSRPEFGSSTDLWLPVFRAGSSTTATEVDYTLVPAGEHPATKGAAGTGTDFTDLTNGTVEFPATQSSPTLGGDTGPRLSWIKIRLYRDRVGEHPETFDVNLVDHNNAGGAVSTRVTILDSDGGPDPDPDPDPEMHPKGRLHHPRHNYKYPRNYPYLNEIHLFTQNAKGLPYPQDVQCPGPDEYCEWQVLFAELAIRKRFKSGVCTWWTGSDWQKRSCSSERWFRMKDGGGEDYFLYRIKKPLTKSVGTSPVRDYKAWSRWFDRSANESTLRSGANRNLFEVMPATEACKKNPFGRKCKPVRP